MEALIRFFDGLSLVNSNTSLDLSSTEIEKKYVDLLDNFLPKKMSVNWLATNLGVQRPIYLYPVPTSLAKPFFSCFEGRRIRTNREIYFIVQGKLIPGDIFYEFSLYGFDGSREEFIMDVDVKVPTIDGIAEPSKLCLGKFLFNELPIDLYGYFIFTPKRPCSNQGERRKSDMFCSGTMGELFSDSSRSIDALWATYETANHELRIQYFDIANLMSLHNNGRRSINAGGTKNGLMNYRSSQDHDAVVFPLVDDARSLVCDLTQLTQQSNAEEDSQSSQETLSQDSESVNTQGTHFLLPPNIAMGSVNSEHHRSVHYEPAPYSVSAISGAPVNPSEVSTAAN